MVLQFSIQPTTARTPRGGKKAQNTHVLPYIELRVAPPDVRPAKSWPWGIVTTFVVPVPYETAFVRPTVEPDTGTSEPRLPTLPDAPSL